MDFTHPIPFCQALAEIGAKALAPTPMGSAEIRDQWDADLRRKSLFSAKQTQASHLEAVRGQLNELLSGTTNVATARAKLQDNLDALNYVPAREHVGGLQDHSSDQRLNLILETNTRQAANAAFREMGQTDEALYQFPAQELVRIYPRAVPRGERKGKDGAIVEDPENGWPARWAKAGGELVDGRMIARKDDPVWDNLGDSGLFADGLDQPYPPFAFNSGMGVRDIPREEALALGVIDDDTDIEGSPTSLAADQENADSTTLELLKGAAEELTAMLSNRAAARPNTLRNRLVLLQHVLCNTGHDVSDEARDDAGEWEDSGGGSDDKEFHDGNKAVDEKGQPMLMHHGSISGQLPDSFDKRDIAFFTPDHSIAKTYAGEAGVVGDYHISMKNPLVAKGPKDILSQLPKELRDRHKDAEYSWQVLKDKDLPDLYEDSDVIDALKEKGHDGLIIHDDVVTRNDHQELHGVPSYAVFDSEQVRPARRKKP